MLMLIPSSHCDPASHDVLRRDVVNLDQNRVAMIILSSVMTASVLFYLGTFSRPPRVLFVVASGGSMLSQSPSGVAVP